MPVVLVFHNKQKNLGLSGKNADTLPFHYCLLLLMANKASV